MTQKRHIAEQFEFKIQEGCVLKTVGSLCAGVGGFDLGFEQAGFETVWQVEINADCQRLLADKFKKIKRCLDVRFAGAAHTLLQRALKVKQANWPAGISSKVALEIARRHTLTYVDIILFGFPCQDLSIAGKRLGFEGDRSSLFYECARIIDELRPKLAVAENVPGILSLKYEHYYEPGACTCGLSTNEATCPRCFRRLGAEPRCIIGTVMGDVLRVMAKLGYSGAGRVLDAQYFGVPQRRRRWFGVFSLGDSGASCCTEILSITEGVRRHPAPSRQKRQGASEEVGGRAESGGGRSIPSVTGALCSRNRGGGGLGTDTELDGGLIPDTALALRAQAQSAHASDLETYVPHLAPSRTARDGKGERQDIAEPSLITVSTHASCIGTLRANAGAPKHESDELQLVISQATTPTVTSNGDAHSGMRDEHGLIAIRSANTSSNGKGILQDGSIHTLDSSSPHKIQNGRGVRRLTPIETERLQGFQWRISETEWSPQWTSDFCDSTRYKMMGNAVAVPCARWIAERIKQFYPRSITNVIP